MLEKIKQFGKGSVVVFAVLGVVAIVTTAIKSKFLQVWLLWPLHPSLQIMYLR
jgi:hypothetical protein